jgi:hypothetical protein
MNLQEPSNNLNKSVFLDESHRINLPQGAYSLEKDRYLMKQIFTPQHFHKLTNFCFDKCVNNFASADFTSEESICLNMCKADTLSAVTKLDLLQ